MTIVLNDTDFAFFGPVLVRRDHDRNVEAFRIDAARSVDPNNPLKVNTDLIEHCDQGELIGRRLRLRPR